MTLLAWGANSYGQLGVGYKCEQLLVPTPVSLITTEDGISPKNIQSISAGAGHTMILTKNGLLFGCGWNSKGQLGLESESLTFTEIKALNKYKITQISCGWDFSAAITDKGQLIVWGSNAFTQLGLPKEIKSVSTPTLVDNLIVKHVSCGLRHMAIVTIDGKIMMTGSGSKGQLGLLDDCDKPFRDSSFKILPGLDNIISVSCGQFHTLCLSANSNVFGWGDNKHGQLGFDRPQYLTPNKINVAVVPRQISTGWTHSVILSKDGEVVTFGRNTYGQLGRDRSNWKPSKMLDLQKIVQMSAGSEHNLAITADNKLLCWGWNEHGNCGTGNTENVTAPVMILPDENVLYTAAGTGQSFAVIENYMQNFPKVL